MENICSIYSLLSDELTEPLECYLSGNEIKEIKQGYSNLKFELNWCFINV